MISKASEFLKQEQQRVQLGLERIAAIDKQLQQQATENEKQKQELTSRLHQIEEALKDLIGDDEAV